MSEKQPPNPPITPEPRSARGVRLRLFAAAVAISAGVAALIIAIQLLRSVLT
jgi:hypothetical protein